MLENLISLAFRLGRFASNAFQAIHAAIRFTTDKPLAPKAEPTANQQAPVQDSFVAVAAERQRQAEYDFEHIPAYIRQNKGIIIW